MHGQISLKRMCNPCGYLMKMSSRYHRLLIYDVERTTKKTIWVPLSYYHIQVVEYEEGDHHVQGEDRRGDRHVLGEDHLVGDRGLEDRHVVGGRHVLVGDLYQQMIFTLFHFCVIFYNIMSDNLTCKLRDKK